MIVNLLHAHFASDHLEAVKAEMEKRGAPVIRALDVAGDIYAFEGCHRLRAAEALGLPVVLEMVDYDGTVDLNTLDFDDCGWFDEREATPVAELFSRMFPTGQAEAFVRVEVA
jgi:hypothetical protein